MLITFPKKEKKMTSLPEVFQKTVHFLEGNKIDYLVIGGIAVATLGYPRMTEDIDFCTFIKKREIKEFQLENYPNPFNPTTTIRFSVDKTSLVSLKIYNFMGQEVIELFHKETGPGYYVVKWDGKNSFGHPSSSGLYFAKLLSEDKMQTIKLLLIR